MSKISSYIVPKKSKQRHQNKNKEMIDSKSLEYSIPWTEKYRPKCIDDIILDRHIFAQLKIFITDVPDTHLIITGAPGVGKTTSVRCIAEKILGPHVKQGYLELNAADDRGIRSITSIIPPFCKKAVDFTASKIILFDEADGITSKCQHDITNMMKEFGKKTKFIFTCNDSTKILEGIQSVCRIIRFKKLNDNQICNYLIKICNTEKIDYEYEGLSTICYISCGDMRKSINDLQKTAYSYSKITKSTVLNICKIPDPDDIKKIISLCQQEKLLEADKELDNMIAQGYYYLDIVSGFNNVLSYYEGIDESLRLSLIDVVNQTRLVVSSGIRSKLQLSALICRLIHVIGKYNKSGIK